MLADKTEADFPVIRPDLALDRVECLQTYEPVGFEHWSLLVLLP